MVKQGVITSLFIVYYSLLINAIYYMLNTQPTEENDILERLRHPERKVERRKMSRNLMIRNMLNAIFIIVAIVAMVGIVATSNNEKAMLWYGVGLFAVVIKMVEVMLRMPGMKKK